MSRGLTQRQSEILQFIQNYFTENNYPPTINEIGNHFNISIKGSYDHIKALEKKKYLCYESGKKRSIRLLALSSIDNEDSDNDTREIPILGVVQAGVPIFSHENFECTMKISKELFDQGNLFGLRVRGDSMIDEGIFEGDVAVIKCVEYFDNGQIVVVEIDGGVTIKRGYKEANHIRLEAANKNYVPITTRSARVLGKLVGLIRKY